MKLLRKGLIPTALLSLAVSACGGGPSVDDVRKDFESPSGSTKDKDGVIAANGKQSMTGDSAALSLTSSLPGFGLSAFESSRGLAAIAPARVFEPRLRRLLLIGQSSAFGALRTESANTDCFNNEELQKASADAAKDLQADGKASFNVSFSVSDLSKCDADLTGGLHVSIHAKVDQKKGEGEFKVKYGFDQVCDKGKDTCIDGDLASELTLMMTGTNAGRFTSVTAWDFTAEGPDKTGVKVTLRSRGGVRYGFGANDQGFQARYEYLQYVNDSRGKEVSYVLGANSDSGSAGSIYIRGSDGQITCTFNEQTGAGQCSGDVSWTGDDYKRVTSSPDFLGD